MRELLPFLIAVIVLPAQTLVPAKPELARGSISGVVVNDMDRKPLRRTMVVLRRQQLGAAPVTAGSDEQGRFAFDDLTPGQYSMTALREGFLTTTTCRHGSNRQPAIFTLYSGQKIDDVTFFLETSGVVAGKVVYDDGEAALGANVRLYKAEFRRGQRAYPSAASVRTNYRGEYSIYGLPPGTYYLCAEDAPLRLPDGAKPQLRRDKLGNLLPDETYVQTFYPSSPKLSHAAPVKLRLGDEISHLDIRLALSRTLRVRGRVTSLLSGKPVDGARFTLRRNDVDGLGSVDLPAQLTLETEGRFELYGVPSGNYELRVQSAENDKVLGDRLRLNVGETDVNDVEIRLRPDREVHGMLRMEGLDETSPNGLRVAFEPRSDLSPARTVILGTGPFTVALTPDETYDVYIQNLPQQGFLSRAWSGGFNLLAEGLHVPRDGHVPDLELAVGLSRAQVNG